jgi:hypothetical protein
MAFAACGGGNNDQVDTGIIIPVEDSSTQPQLCDPVAQTGCGDGEKCSWEVLSEDPPAGRSACVADGNVDVGGPCLRAMPGGTDECRGASHCINGTCTAICSRDPDSCAAGTQCTLFENFFDDQVDNTTTPPTPLVGACMPICDPVMQTCPADQACFLTDWDGEGTCGFVPGPAEASVQDTACFGPASGGCYLNGCARGFSTFFLNWVGVGFPSSLCVQMCTPATAGIGMLDYIMGNPNGAVCGAYDVSAGEIANTECRFFSSVVGDANVPDPLGICLSENVRTTLELGTCATHDIDAAPTQENVDNGTYVLGCESITDQIAMAAKNGGKLPEHIIAKQKEIRQKLIEYYGMQ